MPNAFNNLIYRVLNRLVPVRRPLLRSGCLLKICFGRLRVAKHLGARDRDRVLERITFERMLRLGIDRVFVGLVLQFRDGLKGFVILEKFVERTLHGRTLRRVASASLFIHVASSFLAGGVLLALLLEILSFAGTGRAIEPFDGDFPSAVL